MIDELTKKKRVGGYGVIQDRPLTLHILKDEEDDNDSNFDNTSQAEQNSKPSFKRSSIESGKAVKKKGSMKQPSNKNEKNLFKMANSLKCIPHPEQKPKNQVRIAELDSLTSQ